MKFKFLQESCKPPCKRIHTYRKMLARIGQEDLKQLPLLALISKVKSILRNPLHASIVIKKFSENFFIGPSYAPSTPSFIPQNKYSKNVVLTKFQHKKIEGQRTCALY